MTEHLTIICGDALEKLRELPGESVQCCVTSPPYWSLRDYSTNGQLGLEKTPEEYVRKMVEVFREMRRVLRTDGTLWLNLGSSMAGSRGNYHPDSPPGKHGQRLKETARWNRPAYSSQEFLPPTANIKGFKPKDLIPIPWMVAMALQADGWWLRSDIIWAKPNPMPESVTDRPTKSHEYLFLLTKSASYFYDAEAIKEAGKDPDDDLRRIRQARDSRNGKKTADGDARNTLEQWSISDSIHASNGRNKRSVWTVATAPYPEAHFATYPPDLIKPCIMAGTSAKGCCARCGAPWERVVETTPHVPSSAATSVRENRMIDNQEASFQPDPRTQAVPRDYNGSTKTIGWQPTCKCRSVAVSWDGEPAQYTAVPCTVLDPFAGSGTTGAVALELGRKAILIELNPAYVELIETRCNTTLGLALA